MFAVPSHQTVKLSAGSHASPEDGACLLELASMLGHEQFSDRPASVCPALREFLQGYNDGLHEERRQELYPLASEIVGSRSTAPVTGWRARLCIDWGRSLADLTGVRARFNNWTLANCALAGSYSALAVERDPWLHGQTLQFFRWLAHARVRHPGSLELAQLDGDWQRNLSGVSGSRPRPKRPAIETALAGAGDGLNSPATRGCSSVG